MVSALRAAMSVLTGAVVLAAQPPAADPAVGGIVLGMVLDADTRLRPVFGVPGASSLGPPIAIDAGIQVVAIAPDYILGLRGEAHELIVITPAEQRGISTGVSRVTLSPTGSSAILVLDDGSVRVVSALPKAPRIAWTPDLASLPAPFSSIAVGDDGTAILAAAPDGDRVSIFLVTAESGARVVASAGRIAGLSFIPRTTDALFGDAGAGQVLLLSGLLGSASLAVIADRVSPVDTAGSDDGRRFLIASADPAGVIVIDRASSAKEAIRCACKPAGLFRMGRSGLFRITDSSSGLFWLLDSESAKQRIVAVPPDAPPTSGSAQ